MMKNFGPLFVGALALLTTTVATGQKWHAPHTAPKLVKVSYAQVQPILAGCANCHHGAKAAHGFDASSYASVMKGDKEGKVVVPGKVAKSRLATVLRGKPKLMPPGHALLAAQIATVENWIKTGAKAK